MIRSNLTLRAQQEGAHHARDAIDTPFVVLWHLAGGIDLAAHWAGFSTIALVERDEYCQKVLAKNFLGVPIYDDVTTFDGTRYRGRTTLLSGGFPCQDLSDAGKQAGIFASRSGLFFELARVVQEARPEFVLLENVPALRYRGLVTVIRTLADIGYCSEWRVYSARAIGAPHRRRRLFLVAYPDSKHGGKGLGVLSNWRSSSKPPSGSIGLSDFWDTPFSGVCRVAHGVPRGMDKSRVKALGNAVCPQQCYPILQAIADLTNPPPQVDI
jgi:DNA (cytosine-5)-methyltransferase 1